MENHLHLTKIPMMLLLLWICSSGSVVAQSGRSAASIDNTVAFILMHMKPTGGYGPASVEWDAPDWTLHAIESLLLLNASNQDLEDSGWRSMDLSRGSTLDTLHSLELLSMLGEQITIPSDLMLLASQDSLDQIAVNGSLADERFSTWPMTRQLMLCTRIGHLVGAQCDFSSVFGKLLESMVESEAGKAWSSYPGWNATLFPTLEALRTLSSSGVNLEDKEAILNWVLCCRNSDGGFSMLPGFCSSDIEYTYMALQCFQLLGEELPGKETCIDFLRLCKNPDGGFGDRPKWNSRLAATHWALEAMRLLGCEIVQESIDNDESAYDTKQIGFEQGLKVFTTLFAVGGWRASIYDSPGDIVNIAHNSGLTIIGTKNAPLGFVAKANEYAALQGWGIEIIPGVEDYPTKIDLRGFGRIDHACVQIGAGGPYGWIYDGFESFREKKLDVVHANGSYVFFEPFRAGSEQYQILMDQSVENPGGYDFIDIRKMANRPWIEKYLMSGRLLPITQADQHKDSWSEAQKLSRYRVLYIARNGTWRGFQEAVAQRRICVASSENIIGPKAAVDFARSRLSEWRFWSEGDRPPNLLSEVYMYPITQNLREFEWSSLNKTRVKIRNSTNVLCLEIDGIQTTLVKKSDSQAQLLFADVPMDQVGVQHNANLVYQTSLGTMRREIVFDNSGRILDDRFIIPESQLFVKSGSLILALIICAQLCRPNTLRRRSNITSIGLRRIHTRVRRTSHC